MLRELSFADLDNIHELHSLPETDEYNTLGIPQTIQTTEKIVTEWLSEQKPNPRYSYILCINRMETKQFIGLIALKCRKAKLQHSRSLV